MPKAVTLFDIQTGPCLHYVGPYHVKDFDWRRFEAPNDFRAEDGLNAFNNKLGKYINSAYHRKHGGNEALAEALSGFGRHAKTWDQIAPVDQEYYQKGVDDVRRLYALVPKVGVRPLHWIRPTNTSSGLPYLQPFNGDIYDQTIQDAYALANYIRKTPEKRFREYKVPPTIPFVKAATSKIDGFSTRGIWCIPKVIICIESMFGSPLYDVLLKYRDTLNLPLMIGKGGFAAARGFVTSVDMDQGIKSLDYIKGDKQIAKWKIDKAFNLLKEKIDFKVYEGRNVSDKWARGNERLFEFVRYYFINTPIVWNNKLYRKVGKIPSGSLFTLLIWLIINNIDTAYLSHAVEKRPMVPGDAKAGGDDGLSKIWDSGRTVNDYVEAGKKVGTHYHGPGKSYVAYYPDHMSVKTLSTDFSDPLSLKRDTDDLLARAVKPSNWISCREESVARVLSVSMSTCNTDERLAKFAMFYLNWKPVNLDRHIKMDREYKKYFQTMLGGTPSWLQSTTLRPLVKIFTDNQFWVITASLL